MRRTDRLFEIIQILRSADTPVSAASIAERLEVSQRTIYRHIATLQSMRIPIEGEVGVGYVMRKGYDLPPLNFDEEELEAIIVGLGLLARTGDASLQQAAGRVLSKIEPAKVPLDSLRVSKWGISSPKNTRLQHLRQAIRDEQKLHIHYSSPEGVKSKRVIRPVALSYFIEVAVLSAWCELRDDIRHFRVDRIEVCQSLKEHFEGDGQNLRKRLDSIELQ